MGFYGYIRHLYWKYEDKMTDYEKDLCWHACGLGELEHIFTESENSKIADLWYEEFANYCD